MIVLLEIAVEISFNSCTEKTEWLVYILIFYHIYNIFSIITYFYKILLILFLIKNKKGEYIESIVNNFITTNNQNLINDYRWFDPNNEKDI